MLGYLKLARLEKYLDVKILFFSLYISPILKKIGSVKDLGEYLRLPFEKISIPLYDIESV